MIVASTRPLFTAQTRVYTAVDNGLRAVSDTIGGQILRTVDLRQNQQPLVRFAGEKIQRFFVGQDMRSSYGVDNIPLADFPALLNRELAWTVASVVFAHYRLMKQLTPPELFAKLQAVSEQSNPLAQYDPPHTWVDPNGYRLSDRIWRTSMITRQRIDALISDGIRQGKSALVISRELEQFLLPSRAPFRTKRPYGTDASLDAMRLARSEIAHAHAAASLHAARANPYVAGMDFALSLRHPRFDICDRFATLSGNNARLREPYPIDGTIPVPIESTHPNCLCHLRPAVANSENIAIIVDSLGARVERGERIITPADPYSFLRRMLGVYLVSLVVGEFDL